MDDLKPCPFCGGEAAIRPLPYRRWRVECQADGCFAFGGAHGSRAQAVADWNDREEGGDDQ